MTTLFRRVLSLLLALCLLSTLILPAMVFAEEPGDPPSVSQEPESDPAEETEPAATEPAETEPTETEPVGTEPAATGPAETEPVETEPVETEPAETEPAETEPVETEPAETEPVETEPAETEPVETEPAETEPAETEPGEPAPSGDIEVEVVSRTKNFLGDLFAKMFSEDEEDQKAREEGLAKYPRDHHELSYYEDSLRVRYLSDEKKDGARNYLVYRDSYLLISEEDSLLYDVAISEDGTAATVSPAVFPEPLDGKAGIVFLRENVGCDDILVFADEPVFHGESMTVSLKTLDDLTVTEVFSDGRMLVTMEGANRAATRLGVIWNTDPSGTNWSGSLSNLSAEAPNPFLHFDVWDLEFSLGLNLCFSLDFDITTTGASAGVETKTVAGLSIPVEIFTIDLNYNLQVEFPETPIRVQGTMKTDFSYSLGITGANIKNYRTNVRISDFSLQNPDDYNQDINFYIGSQIHIDMGLIEISFDIYIYTIHLGPVLSLNQDSNGGCRFKARLEKDQYSGEAAVSGPSVHTCAKTGEPGCLSIEWKEVNQNRIYFKIDLYFKSWNLNFVDPHLNLVDSGLMYDSFTFGTGMQPGVCPHKFYRVPVAVWLDSDKTISAPAGINVTVSDTLVIEDSEVPLTRSVTDENGKTAIYLPYKEAYKYSFLADGVIDGQRLTGSALQWAYIKPEDNSQVDIILESDATMRIKTNIVWAADVDSKDVPTDNYEGLFIWLQKRRAGSNASWEVADFSVMAKSADGWAVPEWDAPKYCFYNGAAYLYEYRVRILDGNFMDQNFITPDENKFYITRSIAAYSDLSGNVVQSHVDKYYISYDEKSTEDTLNTTITATAVVDIQLSKSWKLQDPANKAPYVYLALLQKPADGWANKAAERHVPEDWVVALDPMTGASESLRSLQNAEMLILNDDLSSIENRPLAIGKVHDGNGWKLYYTVPKYRNGIQLQFEGYELDGTVVENLLKQEYNIQTTAAVPSFGNYQSVPGPAVEVYYYTLSAVVLNTDPIPANALSGTIYWQGMSQYIPDSVELQIRKDGVSFAVFEVTKAESALDANLWSWILLTDGLDPDADYTVTERIPYDQSTGPDWVGVPYGLNLINYYVDYPTLQAEAQAIFDIEPENLDSVYIGAIDFKTGTENFDFNVEKSQGWYYLDNNRLKSQVAPIENYLIEAPLYMELEGYDIIPQKPYAYTRPGWGNLIYNFTVFYLKNSNNLSLHITKEWRNDDGTAVYPYEVELEVYRDDELIAETTLHRTETGWEEAVITQDQAGKNLNRVSFENYKSIKHVYTVREKPVDGFASTVEFQDDGSDVIRFTVVNTWVGTENVNVAGTVSWEGDEDKEYLRPENVQISVINSHEEYVKSITVPVSGDGKFEANYLPGRDENGEPLTYSVLESHVDGYTAVYAAPTFDEQTRTWTCDVTNKLTGYCPITVKKTVEGKPEKEDKGGSNENDGDDENDGNDENEEETYKFIVEPKNGVQGEAHEFPAPRESELSIQGAGETKAEFILDEDGLYLYTFREVKGETENCVYDEEVKLVLIARTTDGEGNVTFRSWVGVDGNNNFAPTDDNVSDTVEFINRFPNFTIEKKWDIDLEKNDKPDSIEVVIQKKDGDKWETVKLVELKDDEDWKTTVCIPMGKDDEFRVRELKEETALQEIIRTLKENLISFSGDQYDAWLGQVKDSLGDYYNKLPDFIKNAADQGADKLKEALKAKEEDLLDKLLEQVGLATVLDRIVYDKDDSDKPDSSKGGDDDDDGPTTNRVIFSVEEKNTLISAGKVDAHKTEYQVSYDKDGDTYTIENKAILEIDVIKRWIRIGDDGITIVGINDDDDDDDDDDDEEDEDEMPESAWIVLLFKPSADIGENSAAQGIASSAGVDLDKVMDFEFPVINPEEGGKDPIAIITKLAIGVDFDIFSNLPLVPTLAIDKVDADCNWTKSYVVSKYFYGVPMEFKGAELSSEIIRQIIKYVSDGSIDLPISYNPFDNYFSIPTPAIRTLAGITDPGDFLDLSKLAGKFLDKVKNLTMDDIKDFGPETLLDDWHLMANVINVKIDFDLDFDDDLSGTKTWKDDTEENRPEWIKIHVKNGDEELEGSPITLNKSDFEGESEWTWELELPEDSEIDADDCVVSEEYPEDYSYKDRYTAEVEGLNITNTWDAQTVRISGRKIWKDNDDEFSLRPETITIRLLADGEEIASVKTSKEGEWKYFFAEQPIYKTSENEDGKTEKQEIEYTIREDDVENYEAAYDGFNVINTLVPKPGILIITAARPEADAEKEQSYIYTVTSAETSDSICVAVVLEAGQAESSVRLVVPTGTYQIAGESAWSWRWSEPAALSVQVAGGGTAEVRFEYSLNVLDWLNGYAHREETAAPAEPTATGPDALLPEDPEEEKRKKSPV